MIIRALRLTFIFTETILDLQTCDGMSMPLGTILTRSGYIGAVNRRQAGDSLPLGVTLPWPKPEGQRFWDHYLEKRQPAKADGKLCYQKLVPLRLPKLVESIEARPASPECGDAAAARIEGFYYPYGTGLIVTVDITGRYDISEAGALAIDLRHEKIFHVNWTSAGIPESLTLNQLAAKALDSLRERGFGKGFVGKQTNAFSIATVLKGEGAAIDQPLVCDGKVHRLLNGLANWVKGWETQPVPELIAGTTALRLWSKTARAGHVLFAGSRGRAVWFPASFNPATVPMNSLACYHRNLALVSLQTESLLSVASETYRAITVAGPVPVASSIIRLGRLSAELLACLYTRSNTYNSDSVRAQIAQAPQFGDVNALRANLHIDPPL